MPKSKAKRRKQAGAKASGGSGIPWGGKSSPGSRRINLILALLVLAAVAAGGAYWWQDTRTERSFQALADQGRARLPAAVISDPDDGRGHGAAGAKYYYSQPFPTSGRHDPVWTRPGFYSWPQDPGKLVHALEHGHIVIYYDEPETGVLDTLKGWAKHYGGQWQGVVVTPMDGLGGDLVFTAWTKRMRLSSFDAAMAAAFVDAYRGRGPENPVRLDVSDRG